VKSKRVSIFLSESDEWQRRPLYLELLRTLAKKNVKYPSVIRSMAGFTKTEDLKTKVALMSVSGYQSVFEQFHHLCFPKGEKELNIQFPKRWIDRLPFKTLEE
jgi:hypothetical protein